MLGAGPSWLDGAARGSGAHLPPARLERAGGGGRGLEPRSRTTTDAGRIELRADEVVSIEAADGRPLLEVHDSASGPVLRLASPDLTLDVPGALRLLADQLELRARDGGATIEARDDVEIRGEVIHLN